MDSRELMLNAYKQLPDEFAYREVRFYLTQAMKRLDEVQHKKAKHAVKQKTQYEQWREKMQSHMQNPYTALGALDAINDMLEQEEQKLQEIAEKKKKPGKENDATLLG